MSAGVDLSIRTLYDQICAYAHFINEAPGYQLMSCEAKSYVRNKYSILTF